jgi:hypothetical protein
LLEDKPERTVLSVDVLSLAAHGFWEGIELDNSKTIIVFECVMDS